MASRGSRHGSASPFSRVSASVLSPGRDTVHVLQGEGSTCPGRYHCADLSCLCETQECKSWHAHLCSLSTEVHAMELLPAVVPCQTLQVGKPQRGRGGLASACGLGNNEVTNHWVRWDGPTVPFWIPVPEASQGFACHPELLARCWLLLLVWKDTCFAQSGAASARSCFPESCAMLL